jgi:hypothetical protein
VWLKTEYTSLVLFPNDAGLFVVSESQSHSFLVEGSPLQPAIIAIAYNATMWFCNF